MALRTDGIVTKRAKTLSEFINEEQRRFPGSSGVFTSLLIGVRICCKRIAWLVGEGTPHDEEGVPLNVNAESMEAIANGVFLETLEQSGSVAGMLSKEMAGPHPIPIAFQTGHYLLAFSPLDGSVNLDANVAVGSIFSILRVPDSLRDPKAEDFLRPGTEQVSAGYAIYGPTTMLVLSVGRGVHGFTLNRGFGEFILTHPNLIVPASTPEMAVDASHGRFWEKPIQRYVDECVRGAAGPRGVDFATRGIASLVAGVHRVLVRGGLFLSPAVAREGAEEGHLRLLYEANPMAMLIEQAGGAASTGRGRILDVVPRGLHQCVPVVLGSHEEVERVDAYHREHDAGIEAEFTSPLFNERSLFPSR